MHSVRERWLGWRLLLALLLGLFLSAPALAQAPPTGNGLTGDYYRGPEFNQFIVSRHDAQIAFNWGYRPPAPGVPADFFSVRWTGWLVAPASGRYLFHAAVDDGIRIWLNNRLIMNEWRKQAVRRFTAAVELRAGEAYQLRVEYYQDNADTRAYLTWERPDIPLTPPPASWRNLWGANTTPPVPEPIPTRYLFSRSPAPSAAAKPAVVLPPPLTLAKPPLAVVTKKKPQDQLVSTRTSAPVRPRRVVPARRLASAPVSPPAPPLPLPSPVLVADSGAATQLADLAVGEAVTLPDLYFSQSQALLRPAARAALTRLAAALSTQPALRFEVQGHTDNVGNAELNRQLSQRRAEAVCLFLTAHGVLAGQLHPVGYGGTQPVADNTDPTQRPLNRRVVLRRL